MNRLLIIRPFTRSALRGASPFLHKHLRPTSLTPPLVHTRTVASTVSNKPASQTLEHAATNIKEEVGNSATDLAKVIAGTNVKNVNITSTESFLGITSLVAQEVPKPILVFGLAGTIPYLATGATTVYLAHVANLAASGIVTNIDPGVALTILDQALNIQVTYGAVILSFLGALHWGMEIAGYGGYKGYRRLALGAAPLLVAWPSLALLPTNALIVQWIGFTALWWADARANSWGWTPEWYAQYRFYLSILVGTCIIGSLAGTSFFGPVAGHGLLSRDLEMLREQRRELLPLKSQAAVTSDLELVPASPEGDHFVKIHRKEHDSEAKKPE